MTKEIKKLNTEERLTVFDKELSYIEHDDVAVFTEEALDAIPDYFFSIPASSSGRYHPEYALGEGGLVRHTQAAVEIAVELLQLEMFRELQHPYIKDCILSAIILHDGIKLGWGGTKTVAEHPLLIGDLLKQIASKSSEDYKCAPLIAGYVSTHMGQWNKDYKKKVVMSKPSSEGQKFVHLCDYLASRNFIDIKFNKIGRR